MRRVISFCVACAVVLTLAVCVPVQAQLIIFTGADPGANSTDPRPLSDAAAAAFDAALGSPSIITFESSPVGTFASLSPAPGVTVTGSDVSGGNQEIRNTPVSTPDRLFGYNTTSGGANFLSLFGGSATFTFAH